MSWAALKLVPKTLSALVLLASIGLAAAVPAAAQKAQSGGAVLPGGNSGKPVNITAAKLDYYDKEQKLIYTGDVVAIQGDSTLKSSVLTIFLTPKKPAVPGQPAPASSNGRVQRMLAKGPVTLLQRDQVGTGDNGVYDKTTNTVVLTGHVVLTQGPNVSKGDKLVYDMKTGQAKVTGERVSSLFIPDDDTSAKPAAAPPAAPAPKRRAKSARRSE